MKNLFKLKEGVIDGHEYQAPHCDNLVLHAPGECEYCDHYPSRQKARLDQKINFTGHHDPDKATCPAEQRRPIDVINRWHGNVPNDEKAKKSDEEYYAKITEMLKEFK